jgi:hypothetical protein
LMLKELMLKELMLIAPERKYLITLGLWGFGLEQGFLMTPGLWGFELEREYLMTLGLVELMGIETAEGGLREDS